MIGTFARRGCLAALMAVLATAASATSFAQTDRDRNGVVTYVEAERAFPGLAEVHFLRCDPNGDGDITKREFPLLNNFYTVMYVDRD
jgi:hypothetical protein